MFTRILGHNYCKTIIIDYNTKSVVAATGEKQMDALSSVKGNPNAGIRRFSRVLRGVSTLLIVAVPLGVIWTWANFDSLSAVLPSTAGVVFDPENITLPILVGGGLLNMLPGVIAMYGFWRLRQLFGLFLEERYFDREAIQHVRRFAATALAYGFAAPLSRTLIALVVSLSNPPGERVLLVTISSDDLVIIFLSAVFFLIARVWDKAREIDDENAQII